MCAEFVDSWAEEDFEPIYGDFTLTVKSNTDSNVYEATDENYDLLTPIGVEATSGQYDFVLESADDDQLFVSNGTYDEFIDMWLNGEKLVKNVDYTAESGSTRVTIKSQTLKKLSLNETNTIAAEFRVNGSPLNDLKRTAQNFKIVGTETDVPVTPDTPETPVTPETPETPVTPETPDISDTDNSFEPLADPITKTDKDSPSTDGKTDEDKEAVKPDTAEEADDADDMGGAEDTEISDNDVSGDNGSSAQQSKGITFSGTIRDLDGNGIPDLYVELHSKVQSTTTDKNGRFVFENVEFGDHELIVKDPVTGKTVTKEFTIYESDIQYVSDDAIGAADGSTAAVSFSLDDDELSVVNGSVEIIHTDEDAPVPTGSEFPMIMLIVSASFLIFASVLCAGRAIKIKVRVSRGTEKIYRRNNSK